MTLQQLEYVLAIDNFRHFAKAADFCNVTQPTLSMMVQKLEDELDIKIFDRSVQPVQPTFAGQKIINQAKKVLYEASLIKDIVNEEEHSLKGTFKIAVLPTIAPFLLPRFFPQMKAQHPELDLQVLEMTTDVCLANLSAGKIDAAILATAEDDKNLKSEHLYYEQFFGYVSRNESIFKNEVIRSSDIQGERLWLLDEGHCFRDQLMRFCQMESVKNNQASYHLGSMETFMRIVEVGMGLTFIPELALLQLSEQQRELVRPFAIPKPTRHITFVTRTDFIRHSIASLLIKAIQKAVPKEMLTLDVTEKVV